MKRILFLILVILALIGLRLTVHTQTNISSQDRPPSDRGVSWFTYGTKTNTSDLQLQAAPGAGIRVYIYMAYCINTSASTQQMATITWGGTVRTVMSCGPAGIYNKPTYFEPPLAAPANTAVTMQGVGSATTTHLYAAGKTAR